MSITKTLPHPIFFSVVARSKVQMDLQPPSTILLILTLTISTGLMTLNGVSATTFTFTNKCTYTVWPGILPNFNSPKLTSTGFELSPSSSRSLQAPSGFSGRFWGRTDCNSDTDPTSLTPFYCSTGDCGSGEVECNEMGATPPVTLAEFTLNGGDGLDFYDVSLVDGYNVPMIIDGTGGSGACGSTGCVADLNSNCPDELKVENGGACKSACMAFGSPEYCCSGAFNTPDTCRPSVYSEMFKTACPKSYSYAYDDATSTFTCSGADYTITFCPSSPSQKSLTDTTPSLVTSPYKKEASALGGSHGSGGGGSGVVADGSWLAGLAMGGTSSSSSLTKSIPTCISSMHFILICASIITFYV